MGLEPEQVAQLLTSCGVTTVAGHRDRAVLMLARLGLIRCRRPVHELDSTKSQATGRPDRSRQAIAACLGWMRQVSRRRISPRGHDSDRRGSSRRMPKAAARPHRPGSRRQDSDRRPWMYRLAKRWVGGLTGVVSTLAGSIFLMLIGDKPLPHAVPLFDAVKGHPLLAGIVAAALLIVTLTALALVYAPNRPQQRRPSQRQRAPDKPAAFWHLPLLAVTTVTSTVSTAAVISLATLILVHPSWCPTLLCPQPAGPHDEYMEADFTTVESSTFVIPNDVRQYSLRQLPASTGTSAIIAQRVRTEGATANRPPYRLVIRVHNLQRAGTGMFVESVSLILRDVKSVPRPLQVWRKAAPLDYESNPYQALYLGQASGSALAATYAGLISEGHVQLAPGESDELTIRLASDVGADLKFQVRIGYRISSELVVRSFTLPYVFEVVFGDATNWLEYQLRDGRLVQ